VKQISAELSSNILRLILPEELFEYFEIENLNLHSKGFYDTITVQDFPLRNKALYLHIKGRKWVNVDTGDVVSRDWKLVAQGTRYTQSFADFLKGLLGYLPDKLK
jgi:hypothetical protein